MAPATEATNGRAAPMGDVDATRGSRDWAIGTARVLRELLGLACEDADLIRSHLSDFLDVRGWERLPRPKGTPPLSFSDFCRTTPPGGLGVDPSELLPYLDGPRRTAAGLAADPDVGPAAARGANRYTTRNGSCSSGAHGTHLDGSETAEKPAGRRTRGSNKAESIVRRLKRDRPDLAERLARGEIRSARQAGIAAGFIRVSSPLDDLVKAWGKATPADRSQFTAARRAELLALLGLPNPGSRWVGRKEVRTILGISDRALARWLASGKLPSPARKGGGTRGDLWDRAEVEAWQARHGGAATG